MNFEDLAEIAELHARKVRPVSGPEYDGTVYRKWYDWAPGDRKAIKRGMNRRSRHSVRQILANAY